MKSSLWMIKRLDSLSRFSQQRRWVYAASTKPPPLRRLRPFVGKVPVLELASKKKRDAGMPHPYAHGEANADDYFRKMTLSPWVPLPDAAARKLFDMAGCTAADFHVDLGSGDGRVNFHAIDAAGVGRSLGVDIDAGIVQVALERLAKRHPRPPHLQFVVADLLQDTKHPVWLEIQQATVITMYFATEALRIFRPVLEAKLAGRKCKILTCGYEMPGWTYRQFEVVNGLPLYLYEWGTPVPPEEEAEAWEAVMDEDMSRFLPHHVQQQKRLEGEKFKGMNVIDHTNQHPIRGYNPNFEQVVGDDGDADWDAEMEAERIAAAQEEKEEEDVVRTTKRTPCSSQKKKDTLQ